MRHFALEWVRRGPCQIQLAACVFSFCVVCINDMLIQLWKNEVKWCPPMLTHEKPFLDGDPAEWQQQRTNSKQ